jgi:hypothetical protein
VFSTYLGGGLGEEVRGLALGPGGTVTVVGFTRSVDFPVTPSALQPMFGGASPFLDLGDAFVVRLNATGSSLLAASYLGGVFDDIAEAVAVDALGNATIAGWTSSSDFPTSPGAFQPTFAGPAAVQTDGFVCRVDAAAQTVQMSTFLGGVSGEQLLGVDIDATSGDVVTAGWTLGVDYPVTPNALRPTSSGGIDAVVTRLNAAGTTAVFSTYLGGISEDAAQTVRFAANGSVWVGGFTNSQNYPATLNAPQNAVAGASDGFVSHINAIGQSLIFSTLLGGTQPDKVRDLDLAAPGILVVGEAGAGFPVTPDAVQGQFASGVLDGFVTLLSNGGATISWSSYFGGVGQDAFSSAALDDSGIAVVAGWSFSSDFPIAPAAWQGQMIGTQDGGVLQIDLLSDLGDGLEVAPAGSPAVQFVDEGDRELLAVDLHNVTDRALVLDGVRVFVGGNGVSPSGVTGLYAVVVDGAGGELLVGGPMSLPAALEFDMPLQQVLLPAQSTTRLSLRAELHAPLDGSTLEVAAAVVSADAWQLRALGAGVGPDVRVVGTGRAEGPIVLLGRLPGDIDGSAERDVVDLRRVIAAVGTAHAAADTDGDLVLTPIDVAAVRAAILGRGTVFAAATQGAPGQWLTLRGLFPATTAVQGTLGGRAMLLGRATPRGLALRVAADQPLGVQELVVTIAG